MKQVAHIRVKNLFFPYLDFHVWDERPTGSNEHRIRCASTAFVYRLYRQFHPLEPPVGGQSGSNVLHLRFQCLAHPWQHRQKRGLTSATARQIFKELGGAFKR